MQEEYHITKTISNKKIVDWISSARKLKQKCMLAEREANSFLFGKLHSIPETSSIADEVEVFTKQREDDHTLLLKHFDQIRSHVLSLKSYISPTSSQDKAQNLINRIEYRFSQLKRSEKEKYDNLMNEEAILSQQISDFDEILLKWDDAKHQEKRKVRPQSAPRNLSHDPVKKHVDKSQPNTARLAPVSWKHALPFEIEEIEIMMENLGGRNLKWHPRDHEAFLKLHTQTHGNFEAMKTKIPKFLPGIEVSDFEQHFHDYSQYCQLEQQKKALIRDWRKTRENLKEKAIREESEVSDNSSDNLFKSEPKQKRHDLKSKIHAWKEERKQAEFEEKRRKEEELTIKELQELKRREEAAKKREQVKLYKLQKELEEEHHKKALQLLESKTKVTESEFMAIKERNEQHLQKMLDRKARKAEEVEKKKIVESMWTKPNTTSVSKDPDRLLQNTSSYAQKRITPHDLSQRDISRKQTSAHERIVPSSAGASVARGKGYTFSVPKRASPAWRKT